MPDLVSAVIRPKGRVVKQFLEYFVIELFPEKKELIMEAVGVLERDKQRLKKQEKEKNPLPKKQVKELLLEEYSRKSPELRDMLRVEPDYKRIGQPYRVVFDSLDAVVDGQEFRLIGDLNPIETLRDNNVNFAISSSDMLFMNFRSEKNEEHMLGGLKLEEGTELYVNGEYYLIYKKLLEGKYRLNESEKVELAVLKSDGRNKYGIEVVCS